jgi:hypothetical protein
MIRRSDRLSRAHGLHGCPASGWRRRSWTPRQVAQPRGDGAQRGMHARTPGIRKYVLRIRAQAGSPSILVHRLDVAQPTQPTTEEERHERSHP